MPTCELVSLAKGQPFAGEKAEYMELIGLRDTWDIWTVKKIPGLKLEWPSRWERDPSVATLAINEVEYTNNDLSIYGANSIQERFLISVESDIASTLSRLSCVSLLRRLEIRLNKVRDQANKWVTKSKPNIFLKNLESTLLDSIDVVSIAPELAALGKEKKAFEHEVLDFEKPAARSEDLVSLPEILSKIVPARAQRLLETQSAVKEFLIQQGNLTSAREAIRLQRRFGWLTIALAVLTILLAYKPVSDWITKLSE
jgi:hypothetical protein